MDESLKDKLSRLLEEGRRLSQEFQAVYADAESVADSIDLACEDLNDALEAFDNYLAKDDIDEEDEEDELPDDEEPVDADPDDAPF